MTNCGDVLMHVFLIHDLIRKKHSDSKQPRECLTSIMMTHFPWKHRPLKQIEVSVVENCNNRESN